MELVDSEEVCLTGRAEIFSFHLVKGIVHCKKKNTRDLIGCFLFSVFMCIHDKNIVYLTFSRI